MLRSLHSELWTRTNAKIPADQAIPFDTIPLSLVLIYAQDTLPFTNYLGRKLIINHTAVPFITCDAPVILYNQLMEAIRLPIAGDSWASKGIQIFYPISPRMLIHWYDPFMYKVGGNRPNKILHLENPADIFQLNALQYVNCQDQLFFSREFPESELHKLIAEYQGLRNNRGPSTFESPTLTFVSGRDKRINFKTSFNRLSKAGKAFMPDGHFIYHRHPSFVELREKHHRKKENS